VVRRENRYSNAPLTQRFQHPSGTHLLPAVVGGFKHNGSAGLRPSPYAGCTPNVNDTVTIHLRTPSGPFLPAQVISSFAIQSPTALKKYGANSGELRNGTFYPTGSYAFSHPTGTGPFKFVSWTVGEKVVLAANPSYWGPKPKIKTLIIRPISNNSARLQALQTGEVQGYHVLAPGDTGHSRADLPRKAL